jgi:hypothetical protein
VVQNDQEKKITLLKMVQNWPKVADNGQEWPTMAKNGQKLPKVARKCPRMALNGRKWPNENESGRMTKVGLKNGHFLDW